MEVVSGLFQLFVMWTVHLDDEPAAETEEVWIITKQRSLPSKVKAVRF